MSSTKKFPRIYKEEISPLRRVGPGFHSTTYRRVRPRKTITDYRQLLESNSEGNRYIYNKDL